MAACNKQLDLREDADGVLGVIISRDEYREYVELQKKRDRSELSMRARMIENNKNALELSRKVLKLFEKNPGMKYDELYDDIYDLANVILAEE